MKIGGLQKLTLIDYPGKVACTVFLSGCNFRCPFCYAPELVLEEEIKKHKEISSKEFFSFLEKRKGKLEGVVICGGEPTLSKELPEFIEKIRELGFLVKLDTNGYYPKVLKDLFKKRLLDYLAMDVKAALDDSSYKKVVGLSVDTDKIKESINLIKSSKIEYEFRTTVIPDLHKKKDIISIAEQISPADKYFLQNFLPEKTIDKSFLKKEPLSKRQLEEIKSEIPHLFKVCQVRY